MVANKVVRILPLFVLLIAGVWLLGRQGALQPEGAARREAMMHPMGPAGFRLRAAEAGEANSSTEQQTVTPVSIDLAGIEPGVGGYDQHAAWLRGEVDLDEFESAVSAQE